MSTIKKLKSKISFISIQYPSEATMNNLKVQQLPRLIALVLNEGSKE